MSQIFQRTKAPAKLLGTPLQRWATRIKMQHGRKLVIALPYLWLILFFLLPFLIVLKISFADIARAIPPYTELVTWADDQLSLVLNLGNYVTLSEDPL